MAGWDDVRRIALQLPEAAEELSRQGTRRWQVATTTFAWERPLRKADLAELGAVAPAGPVLAVRVPDVGARASLIADDPAVYFTTAHFTGYPAVLVRLDDVDTGELTELLGEAWACRAPRRLLRQQPPADR